MRRVHGPDHKITITADEILKECKERPVLVLPVMKRFHALRYENDGEICIVKGPIEPDVREHNVESNLIIPMKGCTVMCQGLVSTSHLNGELGEVRTYEDESGTGIRLGVYFDKKCFKSALVKPENLRISFDFPQVVKSSK